jgi:carbon monoxide dehydrogenase subunit G
MKLEHEFRVPVPVTQAWDVLLDVERIAPCMPGATVDSFDGETVTGRVKVKVGPIQVTYSGTAKFIEKDEAARRVTLDASGKEARGSGTAKASIVAVLQDEGSATKVNVTTDLTITGKPAQFGRGVMVEVGNKLLGRFADCLAEEIGAGSPSDAPPAEEVLAAAAGGDAVVGGTGDTGSGAAGDGHGDGVGATGAVTGGGGTSSGVPMSGNGSGTVRAAAPQVRPLASANRPATRPASDDAIDLLDVGGAAVLKRVAPLAVGFVVLFVLWRLLRRR